MSFEEEPRNRGYEEPRKAGRSWFAFCGIGCLILLLLCGAGAVITYFTAGDYVKMAIEQAKIHAETLQLAIESDAVKEKLGEPVTVQGFAFPTANQEGENQRLSYRIDLKGSRESGELVVEYLMEPGKGVSRTKFEVIVGDETINLLNSDEFKLDVEDPMDDDTVDDGAEKDTILEEEDVPVGAASDG